MQTTPISNDGQKFTWSYEMSLFKNPTIFITVAKALLLTVIITTVFISLITMIADGFSLDGLKFTLQLGGILLGIFAGLLIIGYLVYAAVMGGKYAVDFTMDEKKLIHTQAESQAKKAKKIGTAAVVAGVLTGRPSTVGAGLTSTRTVSTTEFSDVKKVIVNRRRSTIKLKEIGSNHVYADGEDFDFVKEYIHAHIKPDAVWIEK